MGTMSSSGACSTSSAASRAARVSVGAWRSRSSRNSRRRPKERPPSETSARPSSSKAAPAWSPPAVSSSRRWAGSAGAPSVATAFTDASRRAASMTAAPPRLCPTSNVGASPRASSASAAATRSLTFDEKSVFSKSPSLPPSPVKSKRSTAKPRSDRARAMRVAAWLSLPQVKQWAKRPQARGSRAGSSRRAARDCPAALRNSKRSVVAGMQGVPGCFRATRMRVRRRA